MKMCCIAIVLFRCILHQCISVIKMSKEDMVPWHGPLANLLIGKSSLRKTTTTKNTVKCPHPLCPWRMRKFWRQRWGRVGRREQGRHRSGALSLTGEIDVTHWSLRLPEDICPYVRPLPCWLVCASNKRLPVPSPAPLSVNIYPMSWELLIYYPLLLRLSFHVYPSPQSPNLSIFFLLKNNSSATKFQSNELKGTFLMWKSELSVTPRGINSISHDENCVP